MIALEVTSPGPGGLEGFFNRVGLFRKKSEAKAEARVRKQTEAVYVKSQGLVPIDTGALWISGSREVTGSGFKAVGEVKYTDWKAVIVHERLDQRHAAPRQSRYLAEAVEYVKGKAPENVSLSFDAPEGV